MKLSKAQIAILRHLANGYTLMKEKFQPRWLIKKIFVSKVRAASAMNLLYHGLIYVESETPSYEHYKLSQKGRDILNESN